MEKSHIISRRKKEDVNVFSHRFQLNLLAIVVAEILVLEISAESLAIFVDFINTLLAAISSPVAEE